MRPSKRLLGGALSLGLMASVVPALGSGPHAALRDIPPPTPVPPFGSPSPFPTALATPSPSTRPPRLSSPSAVLEDLDTGQVLFSRAPSSRRPVASVTKIMTALLVLDRLQPSDVVTVRADASNQMGALLGLRIGERITVRNLMYGLLLSSANDAAVALADAVAGSVPAFVRLMNRRSKAMGLRDTSFASPTGLDDRGYSTAADLAAITRVAYASPLFAEVVRTKAWTIPAPSGPPRHIQNRNALLWLYPGAIGVKTGSTSPAGHCLVAAAGRGGVRVTVVVLGAPIDAFDDAAALLNFGLLEFQRLALVARGEAVGSVEVGGHLVQGLSSADLVRLVRRDQVGAVTRRLRPLSGLILPVSGGAIIGAEEASVGGRLVGSVPVVAAVSVAAGSPPPRATGPGPDVRAAALVLRILVVLVRALAGAFL